MTKPRPYGQYFILEKIAQGGMAEIFKGLTYDFSGLKKFIVIKKILPHIAVNPEFIRMLVDEAKIAVQLNHGNIAQTYDLGKVGDDYFIVMEYVDGFTISEVLKRAVQLQRPLPIPVVVQVLRDICQGLDYMHHRLDDTGQFLGIVHCDISPQNVIITHSGTVKILDFGVAKVAVKVGEGENSVVKGKFAYMSPEQTENRPLDSRTDLFSAGIVLWEMLTGRRLFKKKSKTETIEAVQSMTIYPPSAYRSDVPADLDEIVMKALQRDPQQRFLSAADMVLALTRFHLKHDPQFKLSDLHDFLASMFQEAKGQEWIHEKTQVMPSPPREENFLNWETSAIEQTSLTNLKELDFHSLFEEMDLEDVSEVTSSLNEEEFSAAEGFRGLPTDWLVRYGYFAFLVVLFGVFLWWVLR